MLKAMVQLALVLLAAPILQGLIKKTKAYLQNRIGPPVLQPYYDIIKYLRKTAVVSEHASWLTRSVPYISFFTLLAAGLLLPTIWLDAPLSRAGDLMVFVYLLALVRFFTALGALDAGSSFGAMGSSRDMALSAIAEPALLLAAVAVLIDTKTTQLAPVMTNVITLNLSWLNPAYGLAGLAMLIVLIAETGRIPVDNPDTHLELTMIHEGMLLEYSGRYLGLMTWAAHIRQLLMMTLFIDLFFPWGVALTPEIDAVAVSAAAYLLKLVVLGVILALIETSYAKVRLFQVPKLLLSSMALSLLAIVVGIAR